MGCSSLSPYRIIVIVTNNFLCTQDVVLFRMYLALPMLFDLLSAYHVSRTLHSNCMPTGFEPYLKYNEYSISVNYTTSIAHEHDEVNKPCMCISCVMN